ncbi:site-specific integrase [Beggiatoa leptomitoformis]|uniref:Tyrosine-type recombinase/integrase n=1 Tax=Beggiatoa leptomitoformis TaxID=288004 RepID=A0A2N9YFM3_9GAMM|nr:site-specific integrase [Beggiatoa leptomitoformis]ALG69471.2 tyrosine-type recombinase/integrase [Beggiatoa leptomitoformis]AUI69341.1 tyrosine-type recombinase/integrase [Beggiatoa leptomitoformis]
MQTWQHTQGIKAIHVFTKNTGERFGDIDRAFNTATKKAGIEDFHIHDLRHTCASWLAQRGVSMVEIAHLLGHSDIKLTHKRYVHLQIIYRRLH